MSDPLTIDAVLEESNQPLVPVDERERLVATLKSVKDKYSQFAPNRTCANQAQAEANAGVIDSITADTKLVLAAIKPHKDAAKLRHSKWVELEQVYTNPLEAVRKTIKGETIAFQEQERLAALAEQQRLQAIADEAARKEKERLEKLAASRKTEEKKEMYREQAAAVTAPVIFVPPPAKAVKATRRWKVASYDLAAFVEAASKDKALLGYLTLETGKLERTKASNAMFEAKGIRYEQVLQ